MSPEERLKEVDEDLVFFEKYIKLLRRERINLLTIIEGERRIRNKISGHGFVRLEDGLTEHPFEDKIDNTKEKNT